MIELYDLGVNLVVAAVVAGHWSAATGNGNVNARGSARENVGDAKERGEKG